MVGLKEMVRDGKRVRFQYFVNGELWYATEDGFKFPVPASDTGTGIFMAEDKAILFMRYIRKHIVYIQDSKELQESAPVAQPGTERLTMQSSQGDGRIPNDGSGKEA